MFYFKYYDLSCYLFRFIFTIIIIIIIIIYSKIFRYIFLVEYNFIFDYCLRFYLFNSIVKKTCFKKMTITGFHFEHVLIKIFSR